MRTLRLSAVLVVFGCGGGDPPPDLVGPLGDHHAFVVSTIDLPSAGGQSAAMALDLDGDGGRENAAGSLIEFLIENGGYAERVDAELADRLANGELIHLFDVQALALDDARRVGWWPFSGIDPDGDPADNWPGPETYQTGLAGESADGAIMLGSLTASGGRLPLSVALPNVEAPIVFDLHSAAIAATITADGMIGSVGGAIPGPDIDRVLVPALQLALQTFIDDACGVPPACPRDSVGEAVLSLFDTDDDGAIGIEEVRANSIVQDLLEPDIDLEGDRTNDALSLCIGFAAVPATFIVPEATP